MARYISTKLFDNYSVAIRQYKAAHSHCQLLHGYALKFKVWFASNEPLEEKLVSYPDNFDVRGLGDEFDLAMKLSSIDAPLTARRQQMEKLVDKLIPQLTEELKKQVRDDISKWPRTMKMVVEEAQSAGIPLDQINVSTNIENGVSFKSIAKAKALNQN